MRIRTGYSFRAAIGSLSAVADRLCEIGWNIAPITDRLSTFGFTRWTKIAKEKELRPIYGVEIACVPALGMNKPIVDYWTFLALDDLRALHELIVVATNNVGREPSLSYKQALQAPGVAKITGERTLLEYIEHESPTPLYIGLAPSTPKGLIRQARDAGHSFLATSDNYYPRAEDLETYKIALGWRSQTQTYSRYILSDDEWSENLIYKADSDLCLSALENRDELTELCQAEQKTATLLKPKRPAPLRTLCEAGAKDKGCDLSDPIYFERLNKELDLIAAKEFEDYFYILSDMIKWAKQRMVIGPARGSSCGSLVCYLLDITAIDPIPYGLIFERFIDINRADLPDIDVDFSDAKRQLVFEYVEQKYGREHVARLGTVGMFKARSAVKQAGASLRIPAWRTNKVLDYIIERSSADSRAMNTLEDTLHETEAGRGLLKDHPEISIATKLEGQPNISSQHAAGVLITDDPILDYVAIDSRTRAAWCDKKDSEVLNLLKIDMLGLTQLSIFERAMELIGKEPSSKFLEQIPLDDEAAINVLNERRFSGIFQFTGATLRSYSHEIHFDGLMDIVAMTALARPGPLATGGTNTWVKRKRGEESSETLHPMLTELTKDTFGVVVFQEQVMRIVREMGKMSWEDTSAIRKAMSGSLGDEFFAGYWEKFKVGALANGVDEAIAKAIWDQINTFGSWAFNKSHAVAYGIVSYWCCWFKAHYPIEFAAATLDAESDPSKQLAILRELASEGVEYIPFDIDHSTDRWMPMKKKERTILVGPLSSIKGIGPAKMQEILDSRKGGELRPALRKQLENARTEIDSLFPIADRIKELHPNLEDINIYSEPLPIVDAQPGVHGDVMIFGLVKRVAPRDENDAANVQKRGGRILYGPSQSLHLFFLDDTDEIFCKIDRFNYERLGLPFLEKARAGKSLFAIKGTIPRDFRMIKIKQLRYLGEME